MLFLLLSVGLAFSLKLSINNKGKHLPILGKHEKKYDFQHKMQDPRISDVIEKSERPGIDLIGFPSDEGVRRNGGRTGAASAPEEIAEAFYKLTPHPAHFNAHKRLISGSRRLHIIPYESSMEDHQIALGRRVAASLEKGRYPVVLGGGHETAYGHFLGYTDQEKSLSIVNIDAHADVRPFKKGKAHSGSPFRQAVEHPSGKLNQYIVLGLNPASCAVHHLEFVGNHGEFCFEDQLSDFYLEEILQGSTSPALMATMDMDVVHQAQAPGVSASNAGGISSSLFLDIAFRFGKHPSVTSMDISEVNPRFDRDQATVKLAALALWYFSLGLAMRLYA